MSRRLRDLATGDADPHRHHRLLVQDLADAVADLDARRQLLIVLEDMHWADQRSLEVISRLAPRLATRATLVVGAYRNDELSPTTPMRLWRGRLLGQRLADELSLARLSLAETAVLSSALLGATVPTRVVAAIHDRSDGIPLHVEGTDCRRGRRHGCPRRRRRTLGAACPRHRCRRRSGSSLRLG
jgi:predicted ATPase